MSSISAFVSKLLSSRKASTSKRDIRLEKALEAERRVADIVDSHESITHVWLSKRVPNPDTLHSRGEVDVIALAKNGDVFCCEVKNFAGEIVEENGDVVQTKLAIRGKSKPILPKLLQKSECIKRYLNSKLIPSGLTSIRTCTRK